ncbi:hypothetical protein CGL27_15135 [Streptomyces sp. 11-1-2]|nr:hypothetical protein CGL27_15135 [Streptomyces sp. 11-1-2]
MRMTRLKPWEISDELWAVIEPLLPRHERRYWYPGASGSGSPRRATWPTPAARPTHAHLGSRTQAEHTVCRLAFGP